MPRPHLTSALAWRRPLAYLRRPSARALPTPALPEPVAAFLACEVERGIRPSTIGRRVAAIRYAHKFAGLPTPTDDERVKATVGGVRRTMGTAKRKKTPATAKQVTAM